MPLNLNDLFLLIISTTLHVVFIQLLSIFYFAHAVIHPHPPISMISSIYYVSIATSLFNLCSYYQFRPSFHIKLFGSCMYIYVSLYYVFQIWVANVMGLIVYLFISYYQALTLMVYYFIRYLEDTVELLLLLLPLLLFLLK